uniref:Mitochondria-eating protein n=1 Tax=Crocodylus porosus TaxID=8502 RepID=A0A7M4FX44_CROPO
MNWLLQSKSNFLYAYHQGGLSLSCSGMQGGGQKGQGGTGESFHAAKMAFRQFKLRVRKTVSLSYSGPESLEDIVLDYIVRHEDLYDVQTTVNEVIRAMNINPKISFPPEVDFIIISSLIRELCHVAFSMQTLIPPVDIAFGADGELFNDRYRRSYDSDFTAPLVAYHVWPALLENDTIIVKGEAVTKRGALFFLTSNLKPSSNSLWPLLFVFSWGAKSSLAIVKQDNKLPKQIVL